MHFNVMKKRDPTDVPSRGAQGGKEQQWQPRDQCDNEQSAMHEFQAISSEMRPAKELEDWAAKYQREIVWFLAGIAHRHHV
jgi:hypothetical protein